MRTVRRGVCAAAAALALLGGAHDARAQAQDSGWVFDAGFGIDLNLNGNVNSGAIGTLQGVATAILPNPYGDVYGAGIDFRFGGGYVLDEYSEVRGIFTLQSSDADLVRMGDIGPSSLYGQYGDYQSFGLELGYRRYVPTTKPEIRLYGEVTLGAAFIDSIHIQLAAPQSNVILNQTDFYDQTAAFTWSLNVGAMFRVSEKVDLNAQIGLRRLTGLSEVDQLVGTGLDEINNDSARLMFPIVVGVRFRLF